MWMKIFVQDYKGYHKFTITTYLPTGVTGDIKLLPKSFHGALKIHERIIVVFGTFAKPVLEDLNQYWHGKHLNGTCCYYCHYRRSFIKERLNNKLFYLGIQIESGFPHLTLYRGLNTRLLQLFIPYHNCKPIQIKAETAHVSMYHLVFDSFYFNPRSNLCLGSGLSCVSFQEREGDSCPSFDLTLPRSEQLGCGLRGFENMEHFKPSDMNLENNDCVSGKRDLSAGMGFYPRGKAE
ncbi:hypothetical protein E3N88_23181 [Mikania micrantha]|uniref:Uncharacterized protein n=1 Tax=Mikania micrantha TaxID=192012 RepID=A0A5N6NEB5_9ASTR|nr:hypothetical protein E3N88_23181 [Mikania micrantha]